MAKKNTKQKNIEPDFVSKKELESFKEDINNKFDKVLGLLEAYNKPQPAPDPQPVASGVQAHKDEYIPPQYAEIFRKHFDADDGFRAEFDALESLFTIVVPAKFSNDIPANQEFYKVDKRTVKLPANNPTAKVEEWCAKVATNLRYNKNIKTK